MRLDLIVTTRNRHQKLRALLASLKAQTRRPDRVIVVDQSDDGLSQSVVEDHRDVLSISYVEQGTKGAARGRNAGLRLSTGNIIGFPDDDCTYPKDAVERLLATFEGDPDLGVLAGMSVSDEGAPSQGRWASGSHRIDRYNIWVSQTMYTTFYRKAVIERARGFEETLGTGSDTKWGSGEETDLMLRVLRFGVKGLYDSDLRFFHPEPIVTYNGAAFLRGRRYNRGVGRVLSRNSYPAWFVAYMVGRPAIGVLGSLMTFRLGQARYRSIASLQRLLGWMDA